MRESFASFVGKMRKSFASFVGKMRESFACFVGKMRESFASFVGKKRENLLHCKRFSHFSNRNNCVFDNVVGKRIDVLTTLLG